MRFFKEEKDYPCFTILAKIIFHSTRLYENLSVTTLCVRLTLFRNKNTFRIIPE